MAKLNYKIEVPKKDKEKEKQVNKSLYSLSKQEVINGSLASTMPQNVPMNNIQPNMIKANGFGRTV